MSGSRWLILIIVGVPLGIGLSIVETAVTLDKMQVSDWDEWLLCTAALFGLAWIWKAFIKRLLWTEDASPPPIDAADIIMLKAKEALSGSKDQTNLEAPTPPKPGSEA